MSLLTTFVPKHFVTKLSVTKLAVSVTVCAVCHNMTQDLENALSVSSGIAMSWCVALREIQSYGFVEGQCQVGPMT